MPHTETHAPTGAGSSRRNAAVQEFLDKMASAVTAGDGAAVAELWTTPALVLGDEVMHAPTTREQIEQFFSGAKAQYSSRGITDTRPEILELKWPTDRIAIAEVRWPYIDAQGREVGEETSTYLLRFDARDRLKLHVAVMHGTAH